MRRKNNRNSYRITTPRANYAVTLDRIRNDASGNPRFEANILVLNVFGEEMDSTFIYTPVFTFSGHYSGDEEEARWIVNQYEKNL